jgi:MFS family permease
MVSTILPVYMIFSLHLAPVEFGIIDGLYQGAAAIVRILSGVLSDRWGRYKEIALVGYALSAICKLGLLISGAWAWLAAVILVDRTGKGIRTGPRDALISLGSPRGELATAFGVHRALDTAGAMLGPLLAFSLLALVPGAFDAVFVVSFCVALIGLAVLALFVERRPASDNAVESNRRATVADAFGLLRIPRFRPLVLIGALLSLTTISDAFLYLGIQQRMQLNVGFFPLLYVITALVYMLLAVPAGRLADRVGRGRVFVGGYVLLLAVYTLLLLPTIGWIELLIYLALFGAYYSATDGVLMALASACLPEHLRASGLSLLATVTSLGRVLASVLFGLFWTLWGVETTVGLFLGLLAVALVFAAIVIRARSSDAHA